MADEAKISSVVGDVTRAIHDAWEFFLPATIRVFVALTIVLWLGGSEALRRGLSSFGMILGSPVLRGLPTLLEQYKLTAVLPIIALFALSTLAYAFTQLVTGLGFLIPIQFTFSQTLLLLRRCPGKVVWYRMPEVDTPSGLVEALDFEVAKARATAQKSLLSGVDIWSKHTTEYLAQVEMTKFFILWSVTCAILLPHVVKTPPSIGARLLLVLILLLAWGFINLIRAAYAIEQTTHAKITAVVALLTLGGKEEIPSHDDRRTRIDERITGVDLDDHGWWWIRIGSFDWWRSLKDMDNIRIRRKSVHRLPRRN